MDNLETYDPECACQGCPHKGCKRTMDECAYWFCFDNPEEIEKGEQDIPWWKFVVYILLGTAIIAAFIHRLAV